MKNKRIRYSLLMFFALLFIYPLNIFSTENIFYKGTRPMAMGGAFVAVGDDYNARLWNPASLGTIDSWDFTIEATPRTTKDVADELTKYVFEQKGLIQDTEDEFKGYNGSGGASSAGNQKMFDFVQTRLLNKIIDAGNEFYGGFSIRPWKLGIGLSSNVVSRIYVKQSAMSQSDFFPSAYSLFDAKLIYNLTADVVPTISKGFVIKEMMPVPGFLSDGDNTDRDIYWGANFKYLLRYKYSDEDDPVSIMEYDKIKLPESGDIPLGKGMGLDLGALVKVNEYFNVGLNVQDIALSKIVYEKGKAYTQADEEFPTNLRVGMALKPLKLMGYRKLKAVDMTLSADLDNVNGNKKLREKTDFTDKTHLGFETKFTLWKDFLGLGLRAGYNQGFPSYGLTLNGLWIFSVQYTMYGTDLTDYQNISGGFVF